MLIMHIIQLFRVPLPPSGGIAANRSLRYQLGMLHLSISARSLVEVELAHLYQRRVVVDQLIASLEQYANAKGNTNDPRMALPKIEDKLAS